MGSEAWIDKDERRPTVVRDRSVDFFLPVSAAVAVAARPGHAMLLLAGWRPLASLHARLPASMLAWRVPAVVVMLLLLLLMPGCWRCWQR